MIYIEGADGSGKTTLTRVLESDYGYRNVVYPPERFTDKRKELDEWLKFNHNNLNGICERGPLTEIIYRQLDGEKSWIPNFSTFIGFMNNCLVIRCKTPSSFEDSMKRGEDNITHKEDHSFIEKEYDKLLDILSTYSNVKVFTYNWKTTKISEVVKVINEYLTGGNNAV